MTIKERQVTYAFAMVESAKQLLHLASCMIGNLAYDAEYGKERNIHEDFVDAFKSVEKLLQVLERLVDNSTEWSPMPSETTKGAGDGSK